MNNWLFDTNALLWFFTGNKRMLPVLDMLKLPNTQVYISTVSWWEIALKTKAGKLPVDISSLASFTEEYNFIELPLNRTHIEAYMELLVLHKDPFDHMLLSQAISSHMRLITGDAILAEYSSLVMVV